MYGICGKLRIDGRPVEAELIIRQGIFNYDVIKKIIEDLVSNRSDTSRQIWKLIVFQVWYSRYMEGCQS